MLQYCLRKFKTENLLTTFLKLTFSNKMNSYYRIKIFFSALKTLKNRFKNQFLFSSTGHFIPHCYFTLLIILCFAIVLDSVCTWLIFLNHIISTHEHDFFTSTKSASGSPENGECLRNNMPQLQPAHPVINYKVEGERVNTLALSLLTTLIPIYVFHTFSQSFLVQSSYG